MSLFSRPDFKLGCAYHQQAVKPSKIIIPQPPSYSLIQQVHNSQHDQVHSPMEATQLNKTKTWDSTHYQTPLMHTLTQPPFHLQNYVPQIIMESEHDAVKLLAQETLRD